MDISNYMCFNQKKKRLTLVLCVILIKVIYVLIKIY